jgi:hypothetical protein
VCISEFRLISPARIRDFAVPSGICSISAISRAVIAWIEASNKPRPHRAPSGIVRFGVPPGALERLLGDVFSQSLVAGNLVGGAENGPLEPPDERTRELGLAGR